jgi:hypothetical protein
MMNRPKPAQPEPAWPESTQMKSTQMKSTQMKSAQMKSAGTEKLFPTAHMIRSFAEDSGKLFLLYGGPLVFNLSLQMAAQAMAHGSSLAVVDGCNRFNLHALTRFARERRIDPNAFLRQIYISRGFTCYQMEQAITDKLPAFLEKTGSRTAMIFGLLETFYDEQASLQEVQQILERITKRLQQIKSGGHSILIVSLERTVAPKERNRLFTRLKNNVDRAYRLDDSDGGKPHIILTNTAYKTFYRP